MHYNLLISVMLCGLVSSNSIGDEDSKLHYRTPELKDSDYYFVDTFDDPERFAKVWVKSRAKKEGAEDDLAKYDGVWEIESAAKESIAGDLGLVLKSKAKHSAIAAHLKRPFVFTTHPFIIQYEVLLQDGQECGGAYLKLLSEEIGGQRIDLAKFHDKTPYSIMFGPDKCGNDYKMHFIFRHKNPKNGSYEEKHCKKPNERLEDYFNDKKPHLYTLVINTDNSFKMFVDHTLVNQGSLLEDFTPPVNPPAEIDDPTDKKPEDWDDREKIADSTASKPDDWDENAAEKIEDPNATKPQGWLDNEPLHIRNPFAEKPDDWDEDMDGEWEAPLVSNPACEDVPGCGPWSPPLISNPEFKGKWYPPMIDNPNYRGQWKPKRIPNPHFFEDHTPFKMTTITAIGFELWTMSPNILFDNILITDKLEVAEDFAAKTFDLKKELMERDADTFVNRVINYTNAHPWLWAVYIVVLLIPVTVIAVFCCGPAPKEKDRLAAEALHKKSDDIIVDEEPLIPNEDEKEDDDNETTSLDEGSNPSNVNQVKNNDVDDVVKDDSNQKPVDEVKAEVIEEDNAEIEEDKPEDEDCRLEGESEFQEDIEGEIKGESVHPRKRCQRID